MWQESEWAGSACLLPQKQPHLVSSPLQKLVKAISQLKDLQDVFLFRFKTQAPGRKTLRGGRRTGSCWEAEGRREQKGKAPLKSNHLWLHLTSYSYSSAARQSYKCQGLLWGLVWRCG